MTTYAESYTQENNVQDYTVIWTHLKWSQKPKGTQKQIMMTTQAVNDTPEINGQAFKVIQT